MSVKDAFEMFIKIFHRNGTQLMEDTSDLDPSIGVRVTSILGGHQQTVIALTELIEVRGVVMEITQDETDFGGSFAQEVRGGIAVGGIGGSQYGS